MTGPTPVARRRRRRLRGRPVRASCASSRMPAWSSSPRLGPPTSCWRSRRDRAAGSRGRRHPDAARWQCRSRRRARHPGTVRRAGQGPRPVAVPRARVRAAAPRRRAPAARVPAQGPARRGHASSRTPHVGWPTAGRRSTRAWSTSWFERGARATDSGRLTPREQEILALVAEGRSNRSIADALGVAPKTIEGAIGVIFSKLGLEEDARDNRRVLAVLAFLDGGGPAG